MNSLLRIDKNLREVQLSHDILIHCTGYEERVTGLSTYLEGYKCSRAYLLSYVNENGQNTDLTSEIEQRLCKSSEKLFVKPVDGYNPLPCVRDIIDDLRDVPVKPKVAINITTMTKEIILELLYFMIITQTAKEISIFYTEPAKYGDYMTEGIAEVQSIPPFEGEVAPSKDNLLIEFLGFEHERAFAVWDRLEFSHTLLLYPSPAYIPEWQGKSESLNSELVSIVGAENSFGIHSRDPFAVRDQLSNYLSKREYSVDRYNYFLCPMGTKMQAVGMLLYIAECTRLPTVVHPRPLRHNRDFSSGIGPTWLFSFDPMKLNRAK